VTVVRIIPSIHWLTNTRKNTPRCFIVQYTMEGRDRLVFERRTGVIYAQGRTMSISCPISKSSVEIILTTSLWKTIHHITDPPWPLQTSFGGISLQLNSPLILLTWISWNMFGIRWKIIYRSTIEKHNTIRKVFHFHGYARLFERHRMQFQIYILRIYMLAGGEECRLLLTQKGGQQSIRFCSI